MRHWNSRKAVLHLTAILVMILALALMGCGDDDGDGGDDLNPEDLAGKTFIFDANFFNPLLPGTATVTFGPAIAINGDDIPFAATFSGADPGTGITGTATVNSIEFTIDVIRVDDVSVGSIIIGDQTVAVGDTFNIDTQTETLINGTLVITWTNDDGDVVIFSFEEGQNTDTGSTGTGGSGS